MAGGRRCARLGSSDALRAGGKVIKVIIVEGKVIMRLPSTGVKVIKMITQMDNGDTSDRCDVFDIWPRRRRRVGASA